MAAERRSAEEWRDIVEAWVASGESCRNFAARLGVNPTTLAWWKWRLKVARPEAAPPVRFAEVELVDDVGVRDFVIELDHVRVRVSPGFDASELRRLMATLC